MNEPGRISINISDDLAEAVRAHVASGRFESDSEVVRAGLELLDEQDQSLEDWLRMEVADAYDDWKANPSGGLTVDEVRSRLDQARERRQAAA